ncbi:hypothetical protein BY996DRAFT_6410577 [Phakopsora pachyrhizi]|nr:hypothetical protein BY996DRAFT_6410577 [Phakopsora pachyrhizi]
MIGRGSASGRESRKGRVSKESYKKYGGGLTGAAFLQDVAGPTGQEAGLNTRNAASGAAIARRGMWYARVRAKAAKGRRIDTSRDRCGKLPKAGTSGLRKGRNRLSRRGRGSRKGDVDIAEPTTKGGRAGCTVTWGRYRRTNNVKGSGGDVRIDNCRADEGKNTLWRNKDCLTDEEAVGREEAGGRPE